MTKILYLVTQSELGGAQRYIFDLATNLIRRDYQIFVAAGGDEKLFENLQKEKIKTIKVKNLVREINPLKDLLAFFEIRKLLKKIQPDVLHLNSSKAGILGSLAAIKTKIKVIYTAHGFVFNEPMPKWKKLFYLWAEKFSARYKDIIICVSEFDYQVGIKNKIGSGKKLVKINNGIAQINFLDKKIARTELNLPQNQVIIGTIANFYPTKDLATMIKALEIIKKTNLDAILAVIGDGQQRRELENLVKNLGLENSIRLLGQKNAAWQYSKAFDIYVCCSTKEGFPYSVLEAMQAGLPIVSTNVGGIAEMIDQNSGQLIQPNDAKGLAEAIIELVNNKSLADQLGHQAQIEVTQKFSLEKMITKTTEIYQN